MWIKVSIAGSTVISIIAFFVRELTIWTRYKSKNKMKKRLNWKVLLVFFNKYIYIYLIYLFSLDQELSEYIYIFLFYILTWSFNSFYMHIIITYYISDINCLRLLSFWNHDRIFWEAIYSPVFYTSLIKCLVFFFKWKKWHNGSSYCKI